MTSRTDVLYLSSAASPTEFERVNSARKVGSDRVAYGMPQASFKFHNLIQQGMTNDSSVHVYSLVGRPLSPHNNHGAFWRRRLERRQQNWTIDHVAIFNLPLIKRVTTSASFAYRTARWRWRTRRSAERLLIVDGAYVSAIPAVLLALRGSEIDKVAILGDFYSYMLDVQDAASRKVTLVHRLGRRSFQRSMAQMTAFVTLTAQMSELLQPGNRRVLVMEGLVDHQVETSGAPAKTENPTVLYSGALSRKYGAADLVDGFLQLRHPTAELVIFGDGEYVDELIERAKDNDKLTFHGSAPLEKVLAEQRKAWLLINPRPIDNEFTKYSFPSKNMEYMASGTPVLTTALPGMPSEYYDYVWIIDPPGPAGIASALERILKLGSGQLRERGRRAQDFVLANKNNVVQARRILDLIAKRSHP